jgi:hypothetical protein
MADRARDAERPGQAVQCGTGAADLLHLLGGLADRLDHERDRAAFAVEVGDRERDPLARFVAHRDDELTRLRGARHQRVEDLQHVGDVGVVLARDDLQARRGLEARWPERTRADRGARLLVGGFAHRRVPVSGYVLRPQLAGVAAHARNR